MDSIFGGFKAGSFGSHKLCCNLCLPLRMVIWCDECDVCDVSDVRCMRCM